MSSPQQSNNALIRAGLCAEDVSRGVRRLLLAEGASPLCEFSLGNSRRLDVAAIAGDGGFIGVEIKVSVADLKADDKWPEYLPYCDLFYFAVPPEFPANLIPATTGLIVADRFGGAIVRASKRMALAPARRKALTLAFARMAAERLTRTLDPNCY